MEMRGCIRQSNDYSAREYEKSVFRPQLVGRLELYLSPAPAAPFPTTVFDDDTYVHFTMTPG